MEEEVAQKDGGAQVVNEAALHRVPIDKICPRDGDTIQHHGG